MDRKSLNKPSLVISLMEEDSQSDTFMSSIDFTSELYEDLPITERKSFIPSSSFLKEMEFPILEMEEVEVFEPDIPDTEWFDHGDHSDYNAHLVDSARAIARSGQFDHVLDEDEDYFAEPVARTVWKDPLEDPVRSAEDLVAFAKRDINSGMPFTATIKELEEDFGKKAVQAVRDDIYRYYITGGVGGVTPISTDMVVCAVKEALKSRPLSKSFVSSILKQAKANPPAALDRFYASLDRESRSRKASRPIPQEAELGGASEKLAETVNVKRDAELKKEITARRSTFINRDKFNSCEAVQSFFDSSAKRAALLKCSSCMECREHVNGWCEKVGLPVSLQATKKSVKAAQDMIFKRFHAKEYESKSAKHLDNLAMITDPDAASNKHYTEVTGRVLADREKQIADVRSSREYIEAARSQNYVSRSKFSSCEEMKSLLASSNRNALAVACKNCSKCNKVTDGFCNVASLPVFEKISDSNVKKARKMLTSLAHAKDYKAKSVRGYADVEAPELNSYWAANNLHHLLNEKYENSVRDFNPHLKFHEYIRNSVSQWVDQGMNRDAIKDNLITQFSDANFMEDVIQQQIRISMKDYGVRGRVYISREGHDSCEKMVEAYNSNPNKDLIIAQECKGHDSCHECRKWRNGIKTCSLTNLPVTDKFEVTKDLLRKAAENMAKLGKVSRADLVKVASMSNLKQALQKLYKVSPERPEPSKQMESAAKAVKESFADVELSLNGYSDQEYDEDTTDFSSFSQVIEED